MRLWGPPDIPTLANPMAQAPIRATGLSDPGGDVSVFREVGEDTDEVAAASQGAAVEGRT